MGEGARAMCDLEAKVVDLAVNALLLLQAPVLPRTCLDVPNPMLIMI